MKFFFLLLMLFICSCEQKTESFQYNDLNGTWVSKDKFAGANATLTFSDSTIEYDPYVGDTIIILSKPKLHNDTLICHIHEMMFCFKIEKRKQYLDIDGLPILRKKLTFIKDYTEKY